MFQLMVYGGAVLADTVCHLNNWGRSSMPIHTLQVGLKHRQLDTVTFFLKSKESSKLIFNQAICNIIGQSFWIFLESVVFLSPAI